MKPTGGLPWNSQWQHHHWGNLGLFMVTRSLRLLTLSKSNALMEKILKIIKLQVRVAIEYEIFLFLITMAINFKNKSLSFNIVDDVLIIHETIFSPKILPYF